MRREEAYFEFEEKEELPEELDFKRLRPCPHCKKPIPSDSTLCYYCGETVYAGSAKPWWLIAAAIFMIIVFLAMVLL